MVLSNGAEATFRGEEQRCYKPLSPKTCQWQEGKNKMMVKGATWLTESFSQVRKRKKRKRKQLGLFSSRGSRNRIWNQSLRTNLLLMKYLYLLSSRITFPSKSSSKESIYKYRHSFTWHFEQDAHKIQYIQILLKLSACSTLWPLWVKFNWHKNK